MGLGRGRRSVQAGDLEGVAVAQGSQEGVELEEPAGDDESEETGETPAFIAGDAVARFAERFRRAAVLPPDEPEEIRGLEAILRAVPPSASSAKDRGPTRQDQLLAVEVDDKTQNVVLRRRVAYFALGTMVLQLLAINAFMFVLAIERSWGLSDALILGWLSGTFVEIIAVVTVIVYNLFPRHNGGD